MLPEIMGYRRPDGRFGIRNHIAVIATMDNAKSYGAAHMALW